jgi:hypothetical protein
MEFIIALIAALAVITVIAVLGMRGQAAHKEEQRIKAIQEYYHCDADDAVQLLYHMRKSKITHVLKKSGLTL